MIRLNTPEWLEARRRGVTSTDIVAILGLSRWGSEGDVAREKLRGEVRSTTPADERRMRLGKALEDVIRREEEIEHGAKLRRVARLLSHPEHPWALTSLDFERVGERVIVETKASASKRWGDDLPEDVEAQVRWQMGVARYPRAHVAALRFGRELACFDVDHDEATFQRMLVIGSDFMRRLAAGGPFEENRSSLGRAFPLDDGSAIVADAELAQMVSDLIAARKASEVASERAGRAEAAVKMKMGEASLLTTPTYRVTWRRSRDSTRTRWDQLAEQLLEDFPERVREAHIAKHTVTRPGNRRFLIRETGER